MICLDFLTRYKSKTVALRFATSNHSLRFDVSGLRTGTRSLNPTGSSDEMKVRTFVAAGILLNPRIQLDPSGQLHHEAGTQNCGSGSQSGLLCCSRVAGSGCAGRCKFAEFTTTLAARWSNACTIRRAEPTPRMGCRRGCLLSARRLPSPPVPHECGTNESPHQYQTYGRALAAMP